MAQKQSDKNKECMWSNCTSLKNKMQKKITLKLNKVLATLETRS